jgi:phosphopantothenoylcysteine decarboxylase/phosphopantothenate--cysteine ligase
MNRQMWENPATVAATSSSLARRRRRHHRSGLWRPGLRRDRARGECSKPEQIVRRTGRHFQPKRLAGKRKCCSPPGPTFEAIDPVRGITNLSSGKMGFAIARAACEAGAQVTLVCGPVSQAHPARRHPHRCVSALADARCGAP